MPIGLPERFGRSLTHAFSIAAVALLAAACGNASGEPRRQESFQELDQKQKADFAASPDVQIPELRKRLRALGVADDDAAGGADEHGEAILFLSLDAGEFARIDKRALAKLELDSRYRFRLTNPTQIKVFAGYSVAEHNAREKAIALKELADKGETGRFPRYRPGLNMQDYARALESYCGYGPGEALRVVDGNWLEYNNKMTSDAAIAASKEESYAPFACVRRIVYATNLGRHFIGNRGREGAIDY